MPQPTRSSPMHASPPGSKLLRLSRGRSLCVLRVVVLTQCTNNLTNSEAETSETLPPTRLWVKQWFSDRVFSEHRHQNESSQFCRYWHEMF